MQASRPGVSPDWDALRNRALTLAEKQWLREYYAASYVADKDYAQPSPMHEYIAAQRAKLTQAVFPNARKALDMGCSSGRDVRAMRALGIETWGFDVCPDLAEVIDPSLREFVRIGRADHVPYARDDGFDTLISYDVLEHVPIDEVERFPDELRRLGIRNVSCIIAADTISDGHITIQSTEWWVEKFERAGLRLLTELTPALQEVLVCWGWFDEADCPRLVPYPSTGAPRNGWNRVPGHLFFEAVD